MVALATWRNTQDAEPGRGGVLAWRGGQCVGSRRLWPHPVLAPRVVRWTQQGSDSRRRRATLASSAQGSRGRDSFQPQRPEDEGG